MHYLSDPGLLLKLSAGGLVGLAVFAHLIAEHLALRRRQRSWSGEPMPSAQSRRVGRFILALRVLAVAGLVLAVIGWIGGNTFLAYRDA